MTKDNAVFFNFTNWGLKRNFTQAVAFFVAYFIVYAIISGILAILINPDTQYPDTIFALIITTKAILIGLILILGYKILKAKNKLNDNKSLFVLLFAIIFTVIFEIIALILLTYLTTTDAQKV